MLMVLVFAAAAWVAKEHLYLFDGLGSISAADAFLVLLVKLAASLMNGLRFRSMAAIYGLRLRFNEWYGLSVALSFSTYLVPGQLGHVPRAAYLNKRYSLSLYDYGGMVFNGNLVNLAVACVLALAFFGPLILDASKAADELSRVLLIAVGLTIALWALTMLLLRPQCDRHATEGIGARAKIRAAVSTFYQRPGALAEVVLLTVASFAAQGAGVYASFLAIGTEPPLNIVALLTATIALLSVVQITPANIGVVDGASYVVAVALGMTPTEVVPALIVSRMGGIAVHLIVGGSYSWYLFGKILPWQGNQRPSDA